MLLSPEGRAERYRTRWACWRRPVCYNGLVHLRGCAPFLWPGPDAQHLIECNLLGTLFVEAKEAVDYLNWRLIEAEMKSDKIVARMRAKNAPKKWLDTFVRYLDETRDAAYAMIDANHAMLAEFSTDLDTDDAIPDELRERIEYVVSYAETCWALIAAGKPKT